MAVVPRKTKGELTYRVAVVYKGKQYWEPAGTNRREAERLDARRKKEVAEGRYIPPRARSGGITIKAYAERFFDARTNRNAESERTQVERHALALEWFADMRVEDARPPHFLRLVKELRAKTKLVDGVEKRALGEKSVANILGTIRTMFGEAHFNEVISGNPCVLPRKTLKRRSRARAPYNGREVWRCCPIACTCHGVRFSGWRSTRACAKARFAAAAGATGCAIRRRSARCFARRNTTINR